MDKQEILDKTKDVLTPFETENLIKFLKGLTISTIFGNPYIIVGLVVVLFYAVIKRSKFVLLTLFSLISVALLIQYTLPDQGEVTLSSLLPFVFGGLAIGAVLIYFIFIQAE